LTSVHLEPLATGFRTFDPGFLAGKQAFKAIGDLNSSWGTPDHTRTDTAFTLAVTAVSPTRWVS